MNNTGNRRISIYQIILGSLFILFSLSIIWPLLHLLALSISDPKMTSQLTGIDIIPKGFSLINYKVLLSNQYVISGIINTFIVTFAGTALNLLLTAMAAYTLTRPGLIGKKFFMIILIVIMLFEPGMIPEYLVVKKLMLIDNLWSVILYKGVNVYYLIILMKFMENVPASLIEAARIDGAGNMGILFKIVLPLMKPAMATIGMFYAVFHWNEYFRASIYINDPNKTVLQVILRMLVVQNDTGTIIGAQNLYIFNELAKIDYSALKAGIMIITIIPILVIYPLILKYFTKGNLEGGVKE